MPGGAVRSGFVPNVHSACELETIFAILDSRPDQFHIHSFFFDVRFGQYCGLHFLHKHGSCKLSSLPEKG